MNLLHNIENIFHITVQYGILTLEFIGFCVLIFTAISCLMKWVKKDEHAQLSLARGIALALEFKLGGEVLRTVIVRDKEELLVLGAIVLIRAALTFLIHWEIVSEEKKLHNGETKNK
ncbi:MAG: DUF1622 domain-containing protein [Eubacteriaceae bacterium]|nr:DUF1622 domain-containing protein [Eubacteriaceae bacterium]